jgi:hypothetical protein
MGVIKGTNFRIYDGTVPLGYATSCSLSMSAETTETISKDSVASWAESEVDTKSATLSFEGFASEDISINAVTVKSIEDLFTKFAAGTAISWRFHYRRKHDGSVFRQRLYYLLRPKRGSR